jgi:hypothetical protein
MSVTFRHFGVSLTIAAGIGGLVLITMASIEENKRFKAEMDTKGCKVIWHEPGGYEYGYDDGKRVSVWVSGFDLWQCPNEPIFKR